MQVWDIARSSTDIISVLNAKTTPITSQSYTQGLIADWSWDSFQPGPGMKKVSHSTRGHTICPSGQQLDNDGSKCVDRKTGTLEGEYLGNKNLVGDYIVQLNSWVTIQRHPSLLACKTTSVGSTIVSHSSAILL